MSVHPNVQYKRILLKLSGEALGGEHLTILAEKIKLVAQEIADVYYLGVEIGVVLGGGNIFRGVAAATQGMDRTSADHMGMLATTINSLALQDALEKLNIHTRVMSAIKMEQVAEPYIRRRAIRHLEKKRIIIFAGGTGNPFFTTDTAASLRAMEIGADIILKATKVDGIYDKDPFKFSDAVKYDTVTYMDALQKQLKVMDSTAFALCHDNKKPICVFELMKRGNLKKIIVGEKIGTMVI